MCKIEHILNKYTKVYLENLSDLCHGSNLVFNRKMVSMRNITLLTVNVLLCVIPLIANTTPSKELLFVPEDEKSVILNVSDLNLETVSIIDRDGVELFVDVIEENKRKIKYNLNSLPNGQYTIRLNGESFAEFYQATISPTAVNIKKTESYYRPIININNNKLIVKCRAYRGARK